MIKPSAATHNIRIINGLTGIFFIVNLNPPPMADVEFHVQITKKHQYSRAMKNDGLLNLKENLENLNAAK